MGGSSQRMDLISRRSLRCLVEPFDELGLDIRASLLLFIIV